MERGRIMEENAWISDRINWIAQMNCWKSAPVLGLVVVWMPSIRRGSNRISYYLIVLPHHRIEVAKSLHLSRWFLKLYPLTNWNKLATRSRRSAMGAAWIRISSSHHRIFVRKSFCSIAANEARKFTTEFVVPWSTRVGEYMPSGVMQDWHSCEDVSNGSWQYP